MKDLQKDLTMENKVFFTPGDIVTIRQEIPNKPTMLVYRVERSIIRNDNGKDILRGVKCRWFTKDGKLEEAVFSTKDLILL